MNFIKDMNVNGNKGFGNIRVWPGRCLRAPQPVPGRHPTTARKSMPMNIGCWNIRTLLDLPSTITRPERRSALVSKELQRYDLDIVALSETRLADKGQLSELSGGYTFFWSGKEEGCRRESGVAFAVRTTLLSSLEEIPCGVSDRIITMRLPLINGRFVTLVSVYAPTMDAAEDEKLDFYLSLREIVRRIPLADKVIILGDFNARVGRDFETWTVMGKHGVGKCNSNGLMLLQFCSEMGFYVGNTMFQQKNKYKTTWMHPGSKQWHMIDYVLVRKQDIKDISSVRVMRGAECWTDHRLVRAKFRFVVKPKIRGPGVTVPKRLNIGRLKNDVVKQELVKEMEELECENTWDDFKTSVYGVCKKVLGHCKRKHQDWFDENDTEIQALLDSKAKSLHAYLKGGRTEGEQGRLMTDFKAIKREVQRKLRNMQAAWWSKKADEIQLAYNTNNTKVLYTLLRAVYGPSSSSITPLRSKDGQELLRDPSNILHRWREHFDELLNRPSEVEQEFIQSIPCNPVKEILADVPSLSEVKAAVYKLNSGKSPGMDQLYAEIIKCAGCNMMQRLTNLLQTAWHDEYVPQDWRNALMVVLYKGKGAKDDCGNYRGISLLSVVGKVLCRIMLDRMLEHIVNDVLPESQCGFRSGRGTVDMIFTARQLQEKCVEQRMGLYQVFIDLTKAFDTVNRKALWEILKKLGCPDKFISILKLFHDDMKAVVNIGGKLADPISVENGVKQGDITAPTLFALYFAMVFRMAFKDCSDGVYIRYRTTGKLFNIRRLSAHTKVFTNAVRDLLYADDCDLVAHTRTDMQRLMDAFEAACSSLGLFISLKKTVLMYQPAPGESYYEPAIYVYGQKLAVVNRFVYLGSTLNMTGTLDDEICFRISKASDAFGKLNRRLWICRGISVATKVKVYVACILSALLYACETWTTYKKHLKRLERFHQQCLRQILGVRWQMYVSDIEVLERAKCQSIESLIFKHRLRWSGHLVRMNDGRLPKQLFYGELINGKRLAQGPKMRYKDCLRSTLKKCNIDEKTWESKALDRGQWRRALQEGTKKFETNRIQHEQLKRDIRKNKKVDNQGLQIGLLCDQCGRLCMSKAGLISHQSVHRRDGLIKYPVLPGITCKCGKMCKTLAGLKSHFRAAHC